MERERKTKEIRKTNRQRDDQSTFKKIKKERNKTKREAEKKKTAKDSNCQSTHVYIYIM